jgi:aspartate/methionine/tyrosine aminotransferase
MIQPFLLPALFARRAPRATSAPNFQYRIRFLPHQAVPPYVFAEVNRLKAEARAAGVDVIDFGMGNPDMDTPAHIVDKLVETVRKPRTHRYSASQGHRRGCAARRRAITRAASA